MKYCEKCGNELHNQAVICPSCGKSVLHTLTIKREKQFFLVNPKVKIDIDGKKCAEIKNGETLLLELSAGKHNIRFYSGVRNNDCNIVILPEISHCLSGGIALAARLKYLKHKSRHYHEILRSLRQRG